MLKIVHAADLYRRPLLAASMYRDRAAQFKERLRWDAVRLDDMGLEFDEYDELNPVYVIIENGLGEHVGSGRLLPTSGRTMIAEHFPDLTGEVALSSPLIWEVTRFCVSPRLRQDDPLFRRAPAALFWAGFELAIRAGVEFFCAVYFSQMQRVWKAIGAEPEVLGVRRANDGDIYGGIWEITPEIRDRLARRAGPLADAPVQFIGGEDRFTLNVPTPSSKSFGGVTPLHFLA